MKTNTEYLLNAFESFPKKLTVISPDFRILAVTGKTVQNKGINFVGRQCHEVFHERAQSCEDCPAKEVLVTRDLAMRRGYPSNHPDMISCLLSYPIFSDKQIEALAIVDFDFPRLNILENKLQRTNAFLRNLLFSSVDPVIASDMKGKILIFNDAASQLTGYTIDEVINNSNIVNHYPENGARQVMAKLRSDEYGEKGKLKSCHVEILNKNGESIPINLNAAIVYEGEKEVATIGFFHDMREDIRIKNKLENTRIQLLQAEKMASLGKLAAGVAHQLNNPLGGITLFTNLILEDYELDGEVRDDLQRILKDAQRCRDTVKELLEFSRQTNYLKQPQDVNIAISRTLFLLQNQTLFHNIEIIKDLLKTLPPVFADIQQLNHMFMNIILNAAQAMDGKGILTIKTSLCSAGKHIIIEISDTGPGISDDIIKHIFEPFFTTKDQGKGTGLGLSLVYGIVENHGGSIKAQNIVDKGVKFTIKLPLEHNNEKGDKSGQKS
jgi:two-component system, NtrC family, sensor kinase